MQNKKQVQIDSNEWALIDYKIQTITGKSSLKILSLHRYNNNDDSQQSFPTDAAIQVTDYDRDYIDRVVRKIMPAKQIVFYCGHINIHPLAKPNKEFCFLLCKLNLGKIETVSEDNSLANSILLQSQIQKDAFQYNFLLKDVNRYRVEYEVRFTLGNQKEFAENDFECMNCQNKRAKVYCINENVNLCDDCSKEHHARRIMSNHELQKLDKVNSLPHCKKHSQKYKHYCLKCQKYLCDNCLQKGSTHGSNQHPVAEINSLYQDKHSQNDTITAKLKERVQNLARNIEVKREQVEQNYKQTKHFIDQVYENSLRTLNNLFSEKVFLLKSEEIELKMMSDRLQWSRTFIKFQQKNLKPIYYFQSQQKFQVDMQQLRLNDLKTILSIKGDIAAQGQILVASKNQLDRTNKKILNSSRVEDKQNIREQAERVPEYSKLALSRRQRTIYDYDSKAQSPMMGQLGLMLQNSKLNFFCLGSQSAI